MRFSGKTVLVTGAASGIGKAVAELLSAEGAAELILVDSSGKTNELELPCQTRMLVEDVSKPQFWSATDFGTLDHAVINAGVAGAGPITDLTFEEWRRILSVNLDGAFLSLQASLRAMPSVSADFAWYQPTKSIASPKSPRRAP